MKPYYEEDGITIYHGDCRDILPSLPQVDLVLTDPPYGIGYTTNYGTRRLRNGRLKPPDLMIASCIGDEQEFDPGFLFIGKAQILWGANHYAHKLPHRGRWLIWDKRCQKIPPRHQADCEMAWSSEYGAARIKYHFWDGLCTESERGLSRVHPMQKPLAVMRWCLGFYPKAKLIADPFMGSGTTLRAAKDMGCKAIGVEIEERYCEIAAKRLAQTVLEFA